MTKLAQGVAIVAVAAFSLFSQSAMAQKDQHIAVVDVNTVVAALPEYQTANQKVTALQTVYQDSLKGMQSRFQNTQETYSKLGETASADMKKKEQDDLTAQDQSIRAFYDQKFGQQGEISQMQASLLKPITDKIKTALEGFAKKEHYSMIVPSSSVIYSEPSMDQTTKFQDYLKTAQ
ncbi:MAG TPA: OmpH family outer membrane protein [Candidatus Kapabacteria bacterium]|jgi:Skp family chaperone for outer membrane proteins